MNINISRSVGVVLLVAGVVLIIVGIVASRSLTDNVSNFFVGHFTKSTMWYIFGGIASAVVGLLLTLGVFAKARS